jgi:hypothetical protein
MCSSEGAAGAAAHPPGALRALTALEELTASKVKEYIAKHHVESAKSLNQIIMKFPAVRVSSPGCKYRSCVLCTNQTAAWFTRHRRAPVCKLSPSAVPPPAFSPWGVHASTPVFIFSHFSFWRGSISVKKKVVPSPAPYHPVPLRTRFRGFGISGLRVSFGVTCAPRWVVCDGAFTPAHTSFHFFNPGWHLTTLQLFCLNVKHFWGVLSLSLCSNRFSRRSRRSASSSSRSTPTATAPSRRASSWWDSCHELNPVDHID